MRACSGHLGAGRLSEFSPGATVANPNVDSYTNAFDTSASTASWMDWYTVYRTATLTWNSTVYDGASRC